MALVPTGFVSLPPFRNSSFDHGDVHLASQRIFLAAHKLGQALGAAGADAPHGDKLRSAIAATRIGLVRETG